MSELWRHFSWPLAWLWAALIVCGAPLAHASPGEGEHLHGISRAAGARGALDLPPRPADFSTVDAGWLEVEYHPSLAASVRALVDSASGIRQELEQMLGAPVLSHVLVRVGRTPGEMERLGPLGVPLPSYASGVALSEAGLVLLSASPRFPGEEFNLGEVFRHELAHVALHDAVGRSRVPRWFNEGFAVYASGEAEMLRARSLLTATVSGNLIPLAELERSFPADPDRASVAYAQGADIVRYLSSRGQEARFSALFERLRSGQTFEASLADAYATNTYALEGDWKKDVARRYTFWPVLFGGSFLWVGGLGLLIWGYAKRRTRAKEQLERWSREEVLEDARRELARALLRRSGPLRVIIAGDGARIGSVPPLEGQAEAERTQHASADAAERGVPESERFRLQEVDAAPPPARSLVLPSVSVVPKVEHNGGWHTLH